VLRFIPLTLFSIWALASAALAELPKLRAAVLEIGTVNWELDVIKHHGLDKANGFDLDVIGMAGNPATRIALQGGEAEIAVADWIWVARQNADGKDLVTIPYSRSVGALLAKSDSGIGSIEDLRGKKIGIAGGPLDKSWLILRAWSQQEYGFDLADETEQVFGAPPLIFKSALSGDVDAAINFWHFNAKLSAKGFKDVATVSQASAALGLSEKTPLLGYVIKGETLRDAPDLVAGFANASRQAKEILASDDAEWDRLRPRMRAEADADFEALINGFRDGIPEAGPVDVDAASALLKVMSDLGGEELVGKATGVSADLFVQPGS
jgi:NitT/TauT family transport system substrate-binding protein